MESLVWSCVNLYSLPPPPCETILLFQRGLTFPLSHYLFQESVCVTVGNFSPEIGEINELSGGGQVGVWVELQSYTLQIAQNLELKISTK